MYTVTVLYGTPTDPEAFDRHYREVHIPIARRIPGLTRWTLSWIDEQDGDLPGVHLVAELSATDREALLAALASPEGEAARADVGTFATGGVTFLFADEEEVELR